MHSSEDCHSRLENRVQSYGHLLFKRQGEREGGRGSGRGRGRGREREKEQVYTVQLMTANRGETVVPVLT